MTVDRKARTLGPADKGRTVQGMDRESGRRFVGTLLEGDFTHDWLWIRLTGGGTVRVGLDDMVQVTGAWRAIGPDCIHGKHRACDARALDEEQDDIVECTCHCHNGEEAV
ncbi:hypothetical protein JTF08_13595 [Micrococcaceae bacterium RIT802]|nr:hypothetical protein [Micrococcaceae bacterium RIT 802]